MHRLPLAYLDNHPTGDLVSRMVADVDTFADGLLMGFTQLFSGVITIVAILGIMLYLNTLIALDSADIDAAVYPGLQDLLLPQL